MLTSPPNRCRIVLVAPALLGGQNFAVRLQAALAGGDVASLILPQEGLGEDAFQQAAEPLVALAQGAGAAAIVAGDTRVAGRLGADGLHLEGRPDALAEAIARSGGKMIVGAGGAKTRDDALALGEQRPDYILFGRFGYDAKPEPHPRNLSLGRWWAEMIAIPCIVMAGSDIGSVRAAAETGAEFVGLSAAVFKEDADPEARVREANALLDEFAPRWTGA